MRLLRIMKMSPSEIACRSRQEAAKAMERIAVNGGGKRSPGVYGHLARNEGTAPILDLYRSGRRERAAEALMERFHRHGAKCFFPGAGHAAVPDLLAGHHADARAEIVANAEAVCRGEFDTLGYGRLRFGDPVDWHLDPVAGKRSPLTHWSRIDFLDRDTVGDSKVVWELNRHQWLLELGQAWRLTGEERYARTAVAYLRDWMRNNPPGLGINWSSALEVAMRLIAWSWGLFLLRGAAPMTAAFGAEMLGWLRAHAAYVERYLSYYFSPNTHLTGEALGLYYAGVLLDDLQEARRWRELGRRILVEQLDRQVHEDGVYFEQSTRYQYYTLEIYLHFSILAERRGEELPAQLHERLQRMTDFILAVRRPDGSVPQIGDADGGWLLPLLRRRPEDFAPLFALAAARYQRADFAWAAGGPQPELLWMLGPQGWERMRDLAPQPPESVEPAVFPRGGYVVLRSGWDEQAHQMILDTGPLGCHISAGHGHADLLSLQCSANGEPYIVDAGTGCYTGNHRWREYFRGSAAHSTVTVDGRGHAETRGPFGWQPERPAAVLHHSEAQGGLELVEAAHEAYQVLADPVTHRRRLAFVKPDFWLVVDDLLGRASHDVDLRYQFAPLRVAEEADGWVRARGRRGGALLLRVFCAAPLDQRLRTGAQDPDQGWVSPNYGQRVPAPVLTCKARVPLPLRFVTLCYPVADAAAPPPTVTAQYADNRVTALRVDDRYVRIDERGIQLEPPATWHGDKERVESGAET